MMPTLETVFAPAMPQWAAIHLQLQSALRMLASHFEGLRRCKVVVRRDGPELPVRQYRAVISLYAVSGDVAEPALFEATATHEVLRTALQDAFVRLVERLRGCGLAEYATSLGGEFLPTPLTVSAAHDLVQPLSLARP